MAADCMLCDWQVYGQGMCVAAIEAETLQQLLQVAQVPFFFYKHFSDTAVYV